MALVLPRRLAPVFPTTYSLRYLLLTKAHTMYEHLGFPYHTCVHCKGFAPAAPRRAGTSFSVSLSGLPLSRPVSIIGMVVHYTTIYLIDRRPILWHKFQRKTIPSIFSYRCLPSVSRSYQRPKGKLATCY